MFYARYFDVLSVQNTGGAEVSCGCGRSRWPRSMSDCWYSEFTGAGATQQSSCWRVVCRSAADVAFTRSSRLVTSLEPLSEWTPCLQGKRPTVHLKAVSRCLPGPNRAWLLGVYVVTLCPVLPSCDVVYQSPIKPYCSLIPVAFSVPGHVTR